MKILNITIFILFTLYASAQYQLTTTHHIECTDVKSQDKTGTCWSFATSSFLESELIRMGKPSIDLSEMYVVQSIYKDKAQNYMLRQGKANFSEGSLAHDVIRAVAKDGLVPESVYSGKLFGEKHNHAELAAGLKGYLDGVRSMKNISPTWKKGLDALLQVYLGYTPESFDVGGTSFSPKEYAAHLEIQTTDYISLTSFTHHPYYSSFILEIPDNYSNGSFYNVKVEELIQTIDHAISKGYSIAWDGDVSEKGFSAQQGMAILPIDADNADIFKELLPEVKIDQSERQRLFENYKTTDDHLMHIVGMAKDQRGAQYYIIKNSWGERGPYKGYLYMSKSYAAMKTVGILLHHEAVPADIKSKLDF